MVNEAGNKKRKSGIPTLREWENLNFERFALLRLRALSSSLSNSTEFQGKINEVEEKITHKRRKETIFIKKGYESVLFFLRNPKLFPVMKKEMIARSAARHRGEDMLHYEFKDFLLAQHCQLQAAAIFSRDDTSCRNYAYSYHYRHVRNNYAETMGRACYAAEQAFLLYKRIKETELLGSRTYHDTVREVPSVEQQRFSNYWAKFERPSEEKVNELLANRCDDYLNDDNDVSSSEPQKITKQKYIQTEFDFQNQRQ